MPELKVGVLVYGALETMALPPPIIWKDLGLTNGISTWMPWTLPCRRAQQTRKIAAG